MRILLTNDDGIYAPGIVSLFESITDASNQFGGGLSHGGESPSSPPEVFVVAPLTVQSATSHGVTFGEPLMTHAVQVNPRMSGVAVDGRPADCVKLAVSVLWPDRFGGGTALRAVSSERQETNPARRGSQKDLETHGSESRATQSAARPSTRPDLLISGMNAGANCGINVIYSGTVAAAIEGAFLGIPSIAVSVMVGRSKPRFDVAARHARLVLDRLLRAGLPDRHECLSINLPITESDGPLPPIHACPMNTHGMMDQYERRMSPSGEAYYWATGHGLDFHATAEGSDVELLKAGNITVTPLQYDLTRHPTLARWAARV